MSSECADDSDRSMRQRGDLVMACAAASERRAFYPSIKSEIGLKTMNGPGIDGDDRTRDAVFCWMIAAVSRRGSSAEISAAHGGTGGGSLRATELAARFILSAVSAPY